jgi:hypothetical protein
LHPKAAYTRALLDAAPGRGWDFANFRPVPSGAVGNWSSLPDVAVRRHAHAHAACKTELLRSLQFRCRLF